MSEEEGQGPFLAAFTFCETALQGKDDLFSLIRLYDTLTLTLEEDAPSPEVPRASLQVTLFASFRSFGLSGDQEFELSSKDPMGKKGRTQVLTLPFEADKYGTSGVINVHVEVTAEGLYLFEIRHRGALLTRIPLNIVLRHAEQATNDGSAVVPPGSA